MKQLLHIFNISNLPLLKAVHSISTEILPISRVPHNCDVVHISSVCKIPELNSVFNKSFDEITHKRAEFIWRNHSKNNQIHILWSGGIDSTLMAVALLLNAPKDYKLVIYCNLNSMQENQNLYKYFLTQKNIILKNSSIISNEENLKFFTGDLGDQIFGSELIYKIAPQFGFESLSLPYEKIISELFNRRAGIEWGQHLYSRYLPILEHAPFKIETAFDYIWWWNFTQKWQGVKHRKECFLPDNIKPVHFFDCDEYQLWSIYNHDKKIGSELNSYKYIAKEFIFKFDKNEDYLKNKRKLGSPFGGGAYYFGSYTDGTQVKTYNECQEVLAREIKNETL